MSEAVGAEGNAFTVIVIPDEVALQLFALVTDTLTTSPSLNEDDVYVSVEEADCTVIPLTKNSYVVPPNPVNVTDSPAQISSSTSEELIAATGSAFTVTVIVACGPSQPVLSSL